MSHQELQRSVSREEEHENKDGSVDVQSVFLQYPMPYPQDDPSPLLVPHRPTDLMFGNPYSSTDSRGIYAANSPFISVVHSNILYLILSQKNIFNFEGSKHFLGYCACVP